MRGGATPPPLTRARILSLSLSLCATPRSARCADASLYDEPPCTDYVDLPPPGLISKFPADRLPNVTSSPTELFATAAGLPMLLTFAVLLLHVGCCALQAACGSPAADEDDESAASDRSGGLGLGAKAARASGGGAAGETPREELKEAIARSGHRAVDAPLIGPNGMT